MRTHMSKKQHRDGGGLVTLAYSIDEVMEMVGLSRQSVYNQINNGNLRTFKAGKRRLVSPEALNDWVKKLEGAAC